jgi:ABC-2 type transport system permease protein
VSTLAYTVTDSVTMVRRNLKHQLRYPALTGFVIGIPVVLLLLFVYVFGATLGTGLGGVTGGRGAYVTYVVPGILLLTIASAGQGTAISVAMDMTEGIVARFRTMSISRASVLTGHVFGSLAQTMIAVAVVLGVALLIGFRPTAGPLGWLAIAGMVAAIAYACIWLCVAFGIAAHSVESASNTPMFLILLPFLGSGFVPTGSMPTVLRWFAEYQPFTPVTETLRALFAGKPVGSHAIVALAWCAGIALVSYVWSRRLYDRYPSRH